MKKCRLFDEMIFKDKNIVFVGPLFHGYEKMIKENLESLGATVFFFKERSCGYGFKFINNFLNSQLSIYQEKHYAKMTNDILKLNIDFDYLFVIRGFMMPTSFVDSFKNKFPYAIKIMYQWDSNRANKFSHLIPHFDKAFSFDFEDCNVLKGLIYLPLFYSDDIKELRTRAIDKDIDFFFMGWCIPERYDAVLKFKEYTNTSGYSIKAFLYMPKTSYVKSILQGKRLDKSIISTIPMPRDVYLKYLSKSKVMVDVSNSKQTGLAMRVIEALASNTKVLTNNERIRDDVKIYDEKSIKIFDANIPQVDIEFLKEKVEVERTKVYNLEEWLSKVFEN